MLKRVAYTKAVNGTYYPLIELIFYNRPLAKLHKDLAIVDSGADMIVVPYSLGQQLGFTPALDNELAPLGGVGGAVMTVERDCEICLTNSNESELFVFTTKVSWIHPTSAEIAQRESSLQRHAELSALKGRTTDSAIIQQLDYEINRTREEISELNKKFEPPILLGRSFFSNFEHLQFCEKDRGYRSKFIYKVSESKISRRITI